MSVCWTPGKKRYLSAAHAEEGKRRVLINYGAVNRTYKCRCGWWHMQANRTQTNLRNRVKKTALDKRRLQGALARTMRRKIGTATMAPPIKHVREG